MKYNFSIIIPHKNTPDLLQKCLDSIPQREDIQTIVVDDNSDTEKVDFSSFPGLNRKNTEVYFTKEGKGAGYARNVGLEHALGKWILFADADDFFHPCLSDLMDKYVDAEADVIFCKADSINLADGSIAHRAEGYTSRVEQALLTGDFHPVLFYSSPIGKIFKKEIFNRSSVYFNECRWGNDIVFMARVATNTSNWVADEQYLYCITVNSYSISNRKDATSSEVRLQQDLEAIKLYKTKFHLSNIDRYWYYITWQNLYIVDPVRAMRYVGSIIQAIGIGPFVKNYLRFLKHKILK